MSNSRHAAHGTTTCMCMCMLHVTPCLHKQPRVYDPQGAESLPLWLFGQGGGAVSPSLPRCLAQAKECTATAAAFVVYRSSSDMRQATVRAGGGRLGPSERKARPEPASGVHGQSYDLRAQVHPLRTASAAVAGEAGTPFATGVPARGTSQAEASPTTPLVPASSVRCRRTVAPCRRRSCCTTGAGAERRGHLGHTRRSRSARWPRPLSQSSFHPLQPARAAAPRRSHVLSTRSATVIEELFGWPLSARTKRLRRQAHRGWLAGDTRATSEVPGRRHRPSRTWERGPRDLGNRVRETGASPRSPGAPSGHKKTTCGPEVAEGL